MDPNFPPIVPKTEAPPTYQEETGQSHLTIEKVAQKFISKTEEISQSNRLDIGQFRKSLFARVIKEINKRILEPFTLPVQLSVLTNPKNPGRWDWETWERNAKENGGDFEYDAIVEIGQKIGKDHAEKFLSDFLGSINPERYDDAYILSILDEDTFKCVSNLLYTLNQPVKNFILAAISAGLVDEALINTIYTRYVPDTASSQTHEATNSQLPGYRVSFDKLENTTASELAGDFMKTAIVNRSNTYANRNKLMHRFTTILNDNYQCGISVLGINPKQFGNNPTEVSESDWATWEMALYIKKNFKIGNKEVKYSAQRNEEIIEKIEMILLKSKLTQIMLYTAFKASPDILELNLDIPEERLRSKNLVEYVFTACRGKGLPVTKIITGMIKIGCLTKETIDAIYSLGIQNLDNVVS
ncbi:hypothetical protein [Endozoicomonas sp. ONNA2]|uniref:hypothetical protein n=1 Tax=Endozoicomonas sp. ONNA2 TaxID=2828741 RepID=UPI002147824C|nr:hypothetical protein [Endozoicomonas sp. ONNA2]